MSDNMPNNMAKGPITKSFANTYLYNMSSKQYEKGLMDFIMKAEQVNKLDPSFEDIKYEVKKRQVSSALVKVLESKQVILMIQDIPLPKAFKVFCAKDIKGDGKLKVFINADVIKKVEGKYKCTNVDILIAYLVSAMNTLIYYSDPKRLLMREEIINNGASAFSSMFTYIVDYLYKISTVSSTRDKCQYLSSLYYMKNILQKDITDSMKHTCRRISGISEREEELLLMQLSDSAFDNINFFIQDVAKILRLPKLTIDAFLEKWLYIFGTGTQFALELYPSFATMMTNVYVGCYLNNQKTIEKIVGRDMVTFTSAILRVGAESV